MQFHETFLGPAGAQALADRGITEPTPVQHAVWEPFVEGRDLLVQSGTGTGKTLAYLLPLLGKLDSARKDLQALILSPTQELAVQIERELVKLTAGTALRSLALLGGVNLPRQLEQLKAKPHVVVATPGRLRELLEKKKVTGHYLTVVVLDEADRLLAPSAVGEVNAILKTTLKSRQLALFSASLPEATQKAAAALVRDPVVLALDLERPIPETIEHWSLTVERQEKNDVLRQLLAALRPKRTIVFLNQSDQIELVAAKLRHHGVLAESLHGTRFKEDRQRAVRAFSTGEVPVLVASDLAARGLHFEGVTHIVHFDIPEEPLDYQHRCGRTGRAGEPGLSVALATEYESARLKECEKAFGIRLARMVLHHGRVQALR